MKRLLLVCVLFGVSLAPVMAVSPWSTAHKMLKDSIVFLEHCTGFVIDAEKKHILTAAHCEHEDKTKKLLADGTPTYMVFKDERKDLMVLRASGVDKPALKLAAKAPDVGDEIASMGFGYALEQWAYR
jgi:S1-C subfamily serine protease